MTGGDYGEENLLFFFWEENDLDYLISVASPSLQLRRQQHCLRARIRFLLVWILTSFYSNLNTTASFYFTVVIVCNEAAGSHSTASNSHCCEKCPRRQIRRVGTAMAGSAK